MNYPLISEYVEAIRFAEDNFKELNFLRPVPGDDGLPVMTSGGFAVVFKMKDEQTGKLHAVKCFLKELEGRAEAYRMIAEELKKVDSPYLTSVTYLEKELFVDTDQTQEEEFPVLLMDWVEGKTLDKYLRENLDDKYALEMLAYRFSLLAQWLIPQPFAHGDLKPDNILVREDGTLVLVDYDGMYVPAMKGHKARELGSPDFRHPCRTEKDFDEHIDDFSLASILLSLKALSLQPSLREEYGAQNCLLFSERDYRNLSESEALNALRPLIHDAELASLYSLFILAISKNNLTQIPFRLFNLTRPERPQSVDGNLSTEVTYEDLASAWTDEFGVKYSRDKKRLLLAPKELKIYKILEGTLVLCSKAFCYCDSIESISIPNTVTHIGTNAFGSSSKLKEIILPESLKFLSGNPFMEIGHDIRIICLSPFFFVDCYMDEESFDKRYSLYSADLSTIYYCGYRDVTYTIYGYNKYSTDPEEEFNAPFVIPSKVYKIAIGAFYNPAGLYGRLCQEITIPKSVKCIEKYAFLGCRSKIILHDSIEHIDVEAFSSIYPFHEVVHVSKILVPKGCLSKYAQLLPLDYQYLEEYESFPNTNSSICDNTSSEVITLSTVVSDEDLANSWTDECGVIYSKDGRRLLLSVENIEHYSIREGTVIVCNHAFKNNQCLRFINIPQGITAIGAQAFYGCTSLKSISLPDSVVIIGRELFAGCLSLSKIDFSNNVRCISERAFEGCERLSSFVINDNIIQVQDYAFCNCTNLTSLTIGNNVIFIGDSAFTGCSELRTISVPMSVVYLGPSAFWGCYSLSSIILPNTISSIYKGTFTNCVSLTSISIPDSVKYIGDFAFMDCKSLSSITIPKHVESIGDGAFMGCTSLSSISFYSSNITIGDDALANCNLLSFILLPKGARTVYEEYFSELKSLFVEL